MSASILVIACGAIARELMQLKRSNGWDHMDVQCLPAELHNRPEKIPQQVEAKLKTERDRYDSVFVAYADCGTGGALDRGFTITPSDDRNNRWTLLSKPGTRWAGYARGS